jgi:hypothetical protein
MSDPQNGASSPDGGTNDIADNIRRYHAAALAGLEQEKAGAEAWRENTWALACELKHGKEFCQNSNPAFSKWLQDRGLGEDVINADDRAALIKMAAHPEIAKEVLQTTTRRNWRLIWNNDIQPIVVLRSAANMNGSKKLKDSKLKDSKPKDSNSKDSKPDNSGKQPLALPPKPTAQELVKWIEASQRDGINELTRQCKDAFMTELRTEEEHRQFAGIWMRKYLDLVLPDYLDDSSRRKLLLETVLWQYFYNPDDRVVLFETIDELQRRRAAQ